MHGESLINDVKIRFLLAKKTGLFGPGSWLIGKAEGVAFSHVALLVETHGVAIVYESVWPRSRKIGFDDWLKHYSIVSMYSFDVRPDKVKPLVDELESLVGRWYSIPQIIFIGLTLISDWFEKRTRGWILNHSRHLICTELIAILLAKHNGIEFGEKFDRVGLKDIHRTLIALKEKERLNNGDIWIP